MKVGDVICSAFLSLWFTALALWVMVDHNGGSDWMILIILAGLATGFGWDAWKGLQEPPE